MRACINVKCIRIFEHPAKATYIASYIRKIIFIFSVVRNIYHVVATMRISTVILLLKLQLLAAHLVAANIDANIMCRARDNDATGPDIYIYVLGNNEVPSLFSGQRNCTWYRFTVDDISQPIGNGDWNQTQPGYGQFNCIRMDRTIARKFLILPAGK